MPLSEEAQRPLLQSNASPSYASITSPGLLQSSNVDNGDDADVQHPPSYSASTADPPLSWSSAYILITSRVIGSGIFATPGSIVRAAGSPGLSLLIWTVGAVIAGCGLAVYLEYGCMLPRSGGDKVYLELVYKRPRYLATTLIAVQAVLLDFSSANCMVFSQYVLFAFDVEAASDFGLKTLAALLLTAICLVHACFPKTGVLVQNVLGWVKIALIVFMIFVALFVVAFRPGSSAAAENPLKNWDALWMDSDWSWGTIATSLFKVFYSYAGLNNVNNCMNDVKDPVRTLRSVAITALATVFLLYTLVNLAYFVVVPLDEIKESGELIAALFFERSFGPNLGKKILPAAVALSCAVNVMVTAYALVSSKHTVSCTDLMGSVVKAQPRDCSPRVSPFCQLACIFEAFRCSYGWSSSTLCSFLTFHCSPSLKGCVCIHLGCRGVSSPVSGPSSLCGSNMATIQETGPKPAVQSMDRRYCDYDSYVCCPYSCAVLPSAGEDWRFVVCYVRSRRYWNVSLVVLRYEMIVADRILQNYLRNHILVHLDCITSSLPRLFARGRVQYSRRRHNNYHTRKNRKTGISC